MQTGNTTATSYWCQCWILCHIFCTTTTATKLCFFFVSSFIWLSFLLSTWSILSHSLFRPWSEEMPMERGKRRRRRKSKRRKTMWTIWFCSFHGFHRFPYDSEYSDDDDDVDDRAHVSVRRQWESEWNAMRYFLYLLSNKTIHCWANVNINLVIWMQRPCTRSIVISWIIRITNRQNKKKKTVLSVCIDKNKNIKQQKITKTKTKKKWCWIRWELHCN